MAEGQILSKGLTDGSGKFVTTLEIDGLSSIIADSDIVSGGPNLIDSRLVHTVSTPFLTQFLGQ